MKNKRNSRLVDFLLSRLNEKCQEKIKGGEDILITDDNVIN